MKRFIALALCLALMFSLGLSAFATEEVEGNIEEIQNEEPVEEQNEAPEEPEQGSSEEPEAPAEEPLRAAVIAIEAPATIRHLAKAERFPVAGKSAEFGGTLYLADEGKASYVVDKWAIYFPVSGLAQSRYEGLEVFIEMFMMDEVIEVAERGEEVSTVYVDGILTEIENRFLYFPDQLPYEEWVGYTKPEAGIYDNPWLRGRPEKFPPKNSEYTVIADMINCYLVNSDDYYGYIPKDQIMRAAKDWETEPEAIILPEWTPEKQ